MGSIYDIYPEHTELNDFFKYQNEYGYKELVACDDELYEIFDHAQYYFMRIYKNYSKNKYRYLYYVCVIVASKYLDDYDESFTLRDFVDYYFLRDKKIKNYMGYLRKMEMSVLKDLEYKMNK